MSNTVPEVRVDKNGKLVTRHVKQSPAAKWANTPPVRTKHAEQDLRDSIVASLNAYGIRFLVDKVAKQNLRVLSLLVKSFDYSTMETKLLDMEQRLTSDQFKKCAIVLKSHQKIAVQHLKEGSYSDGVGDMIALVTGTLRHKFPMSKSQHAVLIEGICRIWSSDAMDDLSYLNVIFPKRGSTYDTVVFDDATIREDIAKLIVDNTDKLDIIVDCVSNRKISDVEMVKEIIGNSAARSLSAGAL